MNTLISLFMALVLDGLVLTACAESPRQVPDTGQPYGMGAEMGVGSPSTPGSSQTPR